MVASLTNDSVAGEWCGGADVVAARVFVLRRRGRVVVGVAVFVPGKFVLGAVDVSAIAAMPLFLAKASLEHAPAVVLAAPDIVGCRWSDAARLTRIGLRCCMHSAVAHYWAGGSHRQLNGAWNNARQQVLLSLHVLASSARSRLVYRPPLPTDVCPRG